MDLHVLMHKHGSLYVKAAAGIAVSIVMAPVALALVAYMVSITISIIDNTSTAEKAVHV